MVIGFRMITSGLALVLITMICSPGKIVTPLGMLRSLAVIMVVFSGSFASLMLIDPALELRRRDRLVALAVQHRLGNLLIAGASAEGRCSALDVRLGILRSGASPTALR